MNQTLQSVVNDHELRFGPIEERLALHDRKFEELTVEQERCSNQHRRWGEQMRMSLDAQNVSNDTNKKILAALEEQAKFNAEQRTFNEQQVQVNAEQCKVNKEQNDINTEQLKYTKIIAEGVTVARGNWTIFKWVVAFAGGILAIGGAALMIKAFLEWL